MVAVSVGVGLGVIEGVSVGRGVRLGIKVRVGSGVKLSTTGWNGVGVALAFGLTVTRLGDGEDAVGFPAESEQEARNVKTQSTLNARRVRKIILVGVRKVGCNQV